MVSTRSRRHARGFTLIELLVVLAILTLLAGLVGPRVLGQLGGAKSKTAVVQIADLDKSLELFKLDVGRYPTTEEGLEALVKKPGSANAWNGQRRQDRHHLARRRRRSRWRGRERRHPQHSLSPSFPVGAL